LRAKAGRPHLFGPPDPSSRQEVDQMTVAAIKAALVSRSLSFGRGSPPARSLNVGPFGGKLA
jgi:hypothetical protein